MGARPERHESPAPWRPDRNQAALLAALLAGDDDGRLREWAATAGPPVAAVLELLPFAYGRLVALAPDALVTSVAREAHLATAQANLLRIHRLVTAARALDAAGIRCVALKGASVLWQHAGYGDRPMLDVDLLVDPAGSTRALEVLRQLGWLPIGDASPAMLQRRMRVDHALTLVSGDGLASLDLHWAVAGGVSGEATRRCLDNAITVRRQGAALPVPSATDLLVQTLVHAVQPSGRSSCRWLLDASVIIEGAGDRLDWNAVCAWAIRESTTLRVHEALDALVAVAPGRVPSDVRPRLAAAAASPREQAELALFRAAAPHPPLRVLRWHWHRFHRLRPNDREWAGRPAWIGFLEYLRLRSALRSTARSPVAPAAPGGASGSGDGPHPVR